MTVDRRTTHTLASAENDTKGDPVIRRRREPAIRRRRCGSAVALQRIAAAVTDARFRRC